MSSPLTAGDPRICSDIVNAGRSGSDVVLVDLSDSISNAQMAYTMQTWRPYRTVAVFQRGNSMTSAGAGGAGFGATTYLGVHDVSAFAVGGRMNYSMFGASEIVFNGTAAGADANGLTNRMIIGSELIFGLGASSARAPGFAGGVDSLLGTTPVQSVFLYADNTNSYPGIRFGMFDSANAVVGQTGVLNTPPGLTTPGRFYKASPSATCSVIGTNQIEQSAYVPASTTITSGKYIAICGSLLRWNPLPGFIYMSATQGGLSLDNVNDPTWYSDLSLTQSLVATGATHLKISMTQNGTSGSYATALAAAVTRIRSLVPNIKILFMPTWDSVEDASTGLSDRTDATYAQCLATPGSVFLNGYKACGSRTQNVNNLHTSLGDVHPNTNAGKLWHAAMNWNLIELVGGGVVAPNAVSWPIWAPPRF